MNKRIHELKQILISSHQVARNQGLISLVTQTMQKIKKGDYAIAAPIISDGDYARWMHMHEPKEQDLAEQQKLAGKLSYRPLISIVTPVSNPPPELLEDTLSSVTSQTYDNWELCLADANSNQEAKNLIKTFADRDARISVRILDRNQGISGNSNAAIEHCRGDYTAFLDHDDTLAPNALFEVVNCLSRNQDSDLIYSDRDHLTAEGKRTDPLFKPDWSPDMMLCANYVTQLMIIKTKLLKQLGGLRPEMDGAQDWDLILRVAEKTDRILHVPKILYHWRQTPTSVSFGNMRAKPYAKQAQLLTLNQYLSRNGLQGIVRRRRVGYPRIEWSIVPSILVSVVIFDNSRWHFSLHRCVASIISRTAYPNYEIVIVRDENASVKAILPKDSRIRSLTSSRPLNFAHANNLGAEKARGEVIVFLDLRSEALSTNWLNELVGWCMVPQIGAVGPQIVGPDDRILGGVITVGLPNYLFNGARQGSETLLGSTEWYRDCAALSGMCLATKRQIFKEVGPFNEERSSTPNLEYCHRLRSRNYRIMHTPQAKLILRESQDVVEPLDQFHQFVKLVPERDPYYNPNLSYVNSIPTLERVP